MVAREFLAIVLLVAAGVIATLAFPIDDHRVLSASLLLAALIVLVIAACINVASGFSFRPKNVVALAQMLLEGIWAEFRVKAIAKGVWTDKTHVRFVVYIPMRWMSVGPSYLHVAHFLDSNEERNSADFNIDVRSSQGWAGKALANDKSYAADLDQTDSLMGLNLTAKQMGIVRGVFKLRSKVCVPMKRADRKVYGVFCIESCDPMTVTKLDDTNFLPEVVALAGPVLEVCTTAYRLRKHPASEVQ